MNTTIPTDESEFNVIDNPGAQLAVIREQKEYSQEYVASKLHLRVRLIELLEADAYQQMPEPVFVKGYIRAYAKLLGVDYEPFLASFNKFYGEERKNEKALWQSSRQPNTNERFVRWISGIIVVAAIAGISIWWQKNKQSTRPVMRVANHTIIQDASNKNSASKLTQLSKLQSMFKSTEQTVARNEGG